MCDASLQVQADLMSVSQDTDDAIRMAVARVPMTLWHAVTPQLFTYLEHPKVCSALAISQWAVDVYQFS